MNLVDCDHRSSLENDSFLKPKSTMRKKEFLPPKTRPCPRPVLESIEDVSIDHNADCQSNMEFNSFSALPTKEQETCLKLKLAVPREDDKNYSLLSTEAHSSHILFDVHSPDIPGPSHLCNSTDYSSRLSSENVAPEVSKGHMQKLKSVNMNDWNSEKIVLVSDPPPKHLSYQLKNKRQRHVYHTITFLNNTASTPQNSQVSNSHVKRKTPPPLPYKPHYLRCDYRGITTPPLPPRVINKEAMIQRKQLNEEYFENIRCNVDGDFFDILSDVPECSNVASSISINPDSSKSCMENSHFTDESKSKCTKLADSCTSFLNRNEEVYSAYKPKISQNLLLENENCNGFASPASLVNYRSNLLQSLKILQQCGWYWGNMAWQDAEMMLNQRPGEVGLFLVRDSQDPLHILTVSVQTAENTVRHIRVEHSEGKFQLYDPDRNMNCRAADCVRHSNIVTFIKLAMKHSQTGNFLYFVRPKNMGEPPVQIQLLHPVSRFSCVKSLRHYTRFVIRGVVPIERVELLPLPTKLKEYLSKSRYFDAEEDLKCALLS